MFNSRRVATLLATTAAFVSACESDTSTPAPDTLNVNAGDDTASGDQGGDTTLTCTPTCTDEGALGCDGDAVLTCSDGDHDGCLEWVQLLTCDAGTICIEGTCAVACPAAPCNVAGARRCEGTAIAACSDSDGDGCLDWGDVWECGDGLVCANGFCALSCSNTCTAVGARKCDSGAVVTCDDHDQDGCLEWGGATACGAGESCSSGTCAATCTHECTSAGATRCDGGGVSTCGHFDTDDCREWGTVVACAPGEACSNGSCATTCTSECSTLGARKCDGNSIQECADPGGAGCYRWSSPVPCGDGLVCAAGQCETTCSDECSAVAATDCDPGGRVITCGDFDADSCLEWSDGVSCGDTRVCAAGTCEVSCGASSLECGGDCRACPTTGVATTMCSGPACIAKTCVDGFRLSGGACAAESCPAGELFCTSDCMACPTVGATALVCSASKACVATACAEGFVLAASGVCITAGWRLEAIPKAVSGFWGGVEKDFALAVDGAGRAVVVFQTQGGYLAVWRREPTGWAPLLQTQLGASGSVRPGLAIDPSNGVFVTYVTANFDRGHLIHLDDTGNMVASYSLGLTETDGTALAVDSEGEAHVIVKHEDNDEIRYFRTFQGAITPAVTLSGVAWRDPAVALVGSTLHVASHRGNVGSVLATQVNAGIFGEVRTIAVPASNRLDRQLFVAGGAVEFWFDSFQPPDPGVHHRIDLTDSAPTAAQWGAGVGSNSVVAARSTNGVAQLLRGTSTSFTYRTGPISGPTATGPVHLLASGFVGNAVLEPSGRFHALVMVGNGGETLYYVRRD